jgi:hypothetical protein
MKNRLKQTVEKLGHHEELIPENQQALAKTKAAPKGGSSPEQG